MHRARASRIIYSYKTLLLLQFLHVLLWPKAAQLLLHPKTRRNDAAQVVNDFWPVASECDFAAAILQEFEAKLVSATSSHLPPSV